MTKEQCSGKAYDPSGWSHTYACDRNATVTEDGKEWCWQHAPSAVKKRRAASEARSNAEFDDRIARARAFKDNERLRSINTDLLEALEEIKGFLSWMSTYEKKPPEIVKDDFAYDRFLDHVHTETRKWAKVAERAIKKAK